MRLIRCYIAGFGALVDQKIEFDPALTCLLEGNGAGKSTLCAFLRAMLFGMEGYTAATKKFTDREHYTPFSAAPFGGNLTLEKDGAEYRIERAFGKKSEKDDEARLYRDGNLLEISENIGQMLAGLDRQAFERLCFYPAEASASPLTPTVRERLDRILEGGAGEFDAPAALHALEEARKRYRPQRGSGGLIRAAEEEAHKIESHLAELARLAARKEELQETLSEKKEAHALLAAQLGEAALWNERIARRREWERLCRHADETEAGLEELRREFPKGFPTKEETAHLEGALLALRRGVEVTPLAPEKRARLAALDDLFEGKVPSEETLAETRREIAACRRIEGELLAWEHPSGEDAALLARFGISPLGEKEAARIRALADDLRAAGGACPKKKKSAPVLGLLALLAALLGGGGLFFSLPLGIALLAASGLLLGAAAVSLLCGRRCRRLWEKTLAEKQAALRAGLSPYGFGGEDLLLEAERWEEALGRHGALVEERAARKGALTKEREELLRRIGAVVPLEHPEEEMDRLVARRGEYLALLGERAEIDARQRQGEENLRRARDAVSSFCQKWEIPPQRAESAPSRIALCRAEFDTLTARLRAGRSAADRYLAENGVAEKGAEPIDVAEYEALSSRLALEIGELSRAVADCEERLLEREDAEEALALCRERLASHRVTARRLELAATLLKQADEGLRQKYVAPIRERYLRYADRLEKALGQGVHLDRDLCLRFEKDGALREEKYLSRGQRVLCDLAFRLALLEAVAGEGQIPLVLDDPFAELDAAHLEKAKELLRELAREGQIVYLTCHESRALGTANLGESN